MSEPVFFEKGRWGAVDLSQPSLASDDHMGDKDHRSFARDLALE